MPTMSKSFSIFAIVVTALLLSDVASAKKKETKEPELCSEIKGTLAVVEPQDFVVAELYRTGLESPTSLIRQYAQASNCFVVVERGLAAQNIEQEKQLAAERL